jgi:hypothetical protein
MRNWLLLLCSLTAVVALRAADPQLAQYDAVTIAPTKTSIYIGSVSMTLPTFARVNGTYSSTYAARVFPYFFYNEKGRLSIDITDDQLRALARGETVDFEGSGMSSENEPRRIAGKATPFDATTGKIKVRVFVSKKIQLIFNTTYRFGR